MVTIVSSPKPNSCLSELALDEGRVQISRHRAESILERITESIFKDGDVGADNGVWGDGEGEGEVEKDFSAFLEDGDFEGEVSGWLGFSWEPLTCWEGVVMELVAVVIAVPLVIVAVLEEETLSATSAEPSVEFWGNVLNDDTEETLFESLDIGVGCCDILLLPTKKISHNKFE